MKQVEGDLIQMALAGQFDVIIHGCNCFCTMGAGIANQIKKHFPDAYEADLKTPKGDPSKLGKYSFAEIDLGSTQLTVINAYTQFHWKGNGVKVDYDAVKQVFGAIREQYTGQKMAYPMIGAGLAGGNWQVISEIIANALEGEDHNLVKYRS